MEDCKTPKQLLYCEVENGKRPPYKPKLRLKSCVKTSVKKANILEKDWKETIIDRARWRKSIFDRSENLEEIMES
uniref:Uncharacterized protein n=1 Tax=Octopus bimaculoides TaxID=37653 RepID=A0A0L8GLW8_OCTBM